MFRMRERKRNCGINGRILIVSHIPWCICLLLLSERDCAGRWGTLGHIRNKIKKQVLEVRAEKKLLQASKTRMWPVHELAPVSWTTVPGLCTCFHSAPLRPRCSLRCSLEDFSPSGKESMGGERSSETSH